MSPVSVRYIVSDVDAVIPFYTEMLGFHLDMHPAPGFAALSRGDLRLLLNRPGAGGAGQTLGDQVPAPGGWNRFQIEVDDLTDLHARLAERGCHSAARSCRATAAARSWSKIPPATRSSCSSRTSTASR